MWINYLKTAIRNLSKNKGFSIINILGLAVGIAVFILITLYVNYEFSFDKHFKNADRIYRVTMDMMWSQAPTQEAAVAPGPTAYHLAKEYPEVIAGTRFTFLDQAMIEYRPEDGSSVKRFREKNVMSADSNLFRVFELKIIYGNPNALALKNTVIISQNASQRYFGNEDPIGKILDVDNSYKFTVGAVMENIPENTHFRTDFIASTIDIPDFNVNNWLPLQLYSYIVFSENANIYDFEEKLLDFRDRHYTNWKDQSLFRIQKMLDIHLKNDRVFDFAITSDINHVIVLSGVALLILIIACINFMNLSTARSIFRSKEVGIRKVVGGTRNMLITQFIGESILVAMIATFFAIVLVETFIPEFRRIVSADIAFDYKQNGFLLLILAFLVGFVSGIYPAFFTSSFKPILILKGQGDVGGSSIIVRKALVIFQFVIMVLLLIGAGVVFLQMNYVKNKKLGFDKDLIVYTVLDNSVNPQVPNQLKNKLALYANIEKVATANVLPGTTPWGDHFKIEGSDDFFPLRTSGIDPAYLNVLHISLVSGRNFSDEFGMDSSACIINESAAKRFGWTIEEAIGKKVNWNFATSWDNEIFGHVIGVVKDYHFKSLHEEVEAMVLTMNTSFNNIVFAKIHPDHMEESIHYFESVFKEIVPNHPFEYRFLDKDIEALYEGEKRFENIILYFVILATFIACLGLLGLSAFMVEKKFKEIGIRKAFGATVHQIMYLFSKEFAIWVLIANIIGGPIAWYLMNNWLDIFAYRIHIPWWIFIISFILTLVIAIGTVSYLAYKAACKNPVEAIHYE